MDLVYLFLLVILFLLIVQFERKVKRWNMYSPVVVMAGPLVTCAVLANVLSPLFGFIVPNSDAYLIWMLGIACFWLGGVFISCFIPQHNSNIIIERNFTLSVKMRLFMNLTCALMIIIMLGSLGSVLRGRSLLQLQDQEFAMNGVEAHIGGMIMGYLIFYIVSFWEKWGIDKKLAIIYVVVIFFIKMMSSVRGNVILPLIGACIYLMYRGKIKLKVKQVVIIVLSVFVIFMLPTFLFNFNKGVDAEYVFRYFYYYVFSGVLGFSGYLEQTPVEFGTNPDYTNIFWINLWEMIKGTKNYLSPVNAEFIRVDTEGSFIFGANVYTLIGDLYINSGFLIASLYLFSFGAFCYTIFFMAKNGVMMLLWYSFLGASLFLGFFGQYILSPYFYEIQFEFFVLHLITKSKLKW